MRHDETGPSQEKLENLKLTLNFLTKITKSEPRENLQTVYILK